MKYPIHLILICILFRNVNGSAQNLNDNEIIIDTMKAEKERIITMRQDDYFQNCDCGDTSTYTFLSTITKIDNSKQTLNLYGYIPEDYKNHSYYRKEFKDAYNKMNPEETYLIQLIRTKDNIYKLGGYTIFNPLRSKSWLDFFKSASLMTIPYKIRGGNDNLQRITTSGIKNVAINLDAWRWAWERYYQNGKQYKWRLSAGGMISPGVEEVAEKDLRNGNTESTEKLNELFLSVGFTVNLSFNNVYLTFIPAGWDFGTSSIGKNWNYAGRRWWGFGIGISPNFLGPPTNQDN